MAESVSVSPSVDPAAREELLLCIFDLLAAALPLALERLAVAGVSVEDQRAFWTEFVRVHELLSDMEPDYQEMMTDYCNGPDEPRSASFYDLAADMRRRAK